MAAPGVLGEFAPILRGMARLGIAAPLVWEMELHELASSLGVGLEGHAEGAQGGAGALAVIPGVRGGELAAERVRRAREGQPDLATHLASVPADTTVPPVPPEVIAALRARREARG